MMPHPAQSSQWQFRNGRAEAQEQGIFHPLVPQPIPQTAETGIGLVVADGDGEGLPGADQHDELPRAGDGGVEEVALKHDVVLGQHGDDDGGIFAALAFVDADAVGRQQFIEVGEIIDHGAVVHRDRQRLLDGVNRLDAAEVAVENVLVVVIPDLHHLVADSINAAGKIARNVFKDACVGFAVLDLGLPVSRKETPRVLVNENLN